MKKALLSLLVIISLIFITSCNENKTILKEKKLNNFTFSQYVDDELKYTIKKNGYEFVKVVGEKTNGYRDFGEKVYEYTTKTKTVTTSGVKQTIEYVASSSVSTVDFSNYVDALLNIKKCNVTKNKNVYSYNELKNNELLMPFVDGDIYIDNQKSTKLDGAYKNGKLALTSAELTVEKGYVKELKLVIDYSNKTTIVKYEFTNFDTTETNVLKEDNSQYSYVSYIPENAAIVSLTFKGIGTLKLAVFENEDIENVINYFIYLYKKKAYSAASIDTSSSTSIYFGDTEAKKGYKKTITVPEKSYISNKKGTLSLVFTDTDSKKTQQMVLNLSDNTSFDSKVYVPVAVVTEGFELIDRLVNMTSEELVGVSVKVKVEYNNYKYTKPELIK